MIDGNNANRRFHELIWPHRETVLRTARLLMRDSFAADDLAQETMLKAFRSIGRFEDGTDARAWLLTILRNARVDRIRSDAVRNNDVSLEKRDDVVAEEAGDNRRPDWHDSDDLLERIGDEQLIRALQQLPEEIRWTLLLVDVEGLDHADAAEVMKIPVGTVKSRAHRGRMMMRAALEPSVRETGQTP